MTMAGMAFRNVFRYRRRSFITAAAIAFGVMCTVVIDSMLVGAEQESARNIRDFETGDAKIYPGGYMEDRALLPFDRFLEREDRAKIEKGLSGCRWTARTVLAGELYFNEDFFAVAGSAAVRLNAVDPVREGSVFRTPGTMEAGRWLVPGDTGIVLGSWLAGDIGAKVGYSVTVEFKGRGGFYQTFDAEIVGIVLTDSPYVNRLSAFMDLSRADPLLALDGAVTEYAVRFDPAKRFGTELVALKTGLPAYAADIYTWDQIEEDAIKLTKAKSGGSRIYLVFMFIIAAVGISNTMLMAVMERRAEIGMMRALGYGRQTIRWLFLVEGFAIALIGTAAGTALGCAVTAYLVERGIDFSFMLRDIDVGYRLTGIMRSAWHPAGIVSTAIGALVISSVVAWFPSGRILKAEVAEILRK